MPLWGNEDVASNSAISVLMQLNKEITTNNQIELFGNTTANVYHDGDEIIGQFAFSASEISAAAGNGSAHPAHSGWALRTEGSGGRAGRVFYETLVAMSEIVGDAENTVTPDVVIVVDTQPADALLEVLNDPHNFIVVAHTVPAGATITYKWQKDGGPGAQTWADIANTGIFASANSNNTSTLSLSNNSTIGANNFRCILTVSGGPTVHTSNAILTIAP